MSGTGDTLNLHLRPRPLLACLVLKGGDSSPVPESNQPCPLQKQCKPAGLSSPLLPLLTHAPTHIPPLPFPGAFRNVQIHIHNSAAASGLGNGEGESERQARPSPCKPGSCARGSRLARPSTQPPTSTHAFCQAILLLGPIGAPLDAGRAQGLRASERASEERLLRGSHQPSTWAAVVAAAFPGGGGGGLMSEAGRESESERLRPERGTYLCLAVGFPGASSCRLLAPEV